MTEFIDPEIRASFRTNEVGFVSRSAGGFISCPPYIIASVAQRRIAEGAELSLPEGYSNDTLEIIQGQTGWLDRDTRVSPRQAEELAQIGRQVLTLNEQGAVQPPLNLTEKQSIGHLVTLVDQMLAE